MSYLGFVKNVLDSYDFKDGFPKILEIGVDKGQSALPIIQNLSCKFEKFLYAGIDIKIRPEVVEQITQFANVCVSGYDDLSCRDVLFFQENSLDWLSANQDASLKFDIVFLDGDHNYHTVINELYMIQGIINPESLIVCDDYFGKFSLKDSWYSEKEEYKDVEKSTKRTEGKKEGVKNAIDDFSRETTWRGLAFPGFEPILLYRSDVWKVGVDPPYVGDGVLFRDLTLEFTSVRSNEA